MSERKIDPKLLEILVCPLTKGPLRYDAGAAELISDQAHLAYPIRDGIPIMLADEARPLDNSEPIPPQGPPQGKT
ncbi:MAG: Trm112 family protein [Rhodospirillales bacterium]|nr:Trm112 family protein [Alphaproteobacteria bacterium]MBL6928824.1 Trm112 family protein [Rhodospirillales bacterium]